MLPLALCLLCTANLQRCFVTSGLLATLRVEMLTL